MGLDTQLAAGGADPRIGMVLQDRYEILRKLGEGGMGAVYEGEHVLIKRRVAIKCLHAHYAASPEIVARFHREALAATSIRHPNIVEVTDMGRFPDGAFFMVLEFLDGRDWADDLAREGAQSLGRVVHIMSQVCDALQAAHDKGIVHRDLKPENIFLTKRGDDPDFAKVLDFGISKMQGSPGDSESEVRSKGLTRTGMAMGTPYYMAPEQAQGLKDIDHRADIYALGVILFQALTAQYPFDDESYPMLVMKLCTEDAPPIARWRPDLPAEVQALVASMLAKKPGERPATCAEVRAALEPFRSHVDAPVLRKDAGSTANLSLGTFGEGAADGAPAASAVSTPFPMTTPAGHERASAPSTSTRPLSDAAPYSASIDDRLESLASGASRRGGPPVAIVAAAGAVLLVTLGAIGVAMLGDAPTDAAPDPTSTAGATPEPAASVDEPPVAPREAARAREVEPAVAAQRTVRVEISTVPEDATVYLDDRRIPNPFDGELPQTSEPRNLRVEREGHVTYVQDLVLEFAQTVRVRLPRGRGTEDQRAGAARGGGREPGLVRATEPRAGAQVAAPREQPEMPRIVETPPTIDTPTIDTPTIDTPIIDTPRVVTPPETAPEGERRTLKNPFGRR